MEMRISWRSLTIIRRGDRRKRDAVRVGEEGKKEEMMIPFSLLIRKDEHGGTGLDCLFRGCMPATAGNRDIEYYANMRER